MSLVSELNTYENIQSFRDALKSYVAFVEGTNNPDLIKGLEDYLSDWGDIVSNEFVSRGVDVGNKDSILMSINDMLRELEASDYVEITLSFNPDPDFRSKLSRWFNENISDNLSLLIRTDIEIGGGAKISYKGKFKDYSIEKRLKDYFNSRAYNDK